MSCCIRLIMYKPLLEKYDEHSLKRHVPISSNCFIVPFIQCDCTAVIVWKNTTLLWPKCNQTNKTRVILTCATTVYIW